ncbi:hypothetical protein [Klebsiella sp. BIGb0407]|uniref:hypothetical protein n=1 Tax=Klebsiella sp. BIGb0407 TaxID=2940603 RepID=UPI0021683B18|nr:hypothetical protein [Klebsiella sp. BIGb0407]MCS3432351.1 hypothetical protein [Klebsiella sp. BIGb0407]
MLSHFGYEENIQSGRHGSNHLCILDANSHEILSVTLDDTGSYILESEGYRKTHPLTATPQQMAKAPPKTEKYYDVIWSAWERAASPEEAPSRTKVVQKLNRCLHDSYTKLELRNLNLTTLPDFLPQNILELEIENTSLSSLSQLPSALQKLTVHDISLIRLPKLPAGLQHLDLHTHQLIKVPALPLNLVTLKLDTLLTRIPALPLNLVTLTVDSQLTKMPELPPKLQVLELRNTKFTSLPPLPSGLKRLLIADTKLASLPESIASLSREAEVLLSNNPLTERTLLTLRNMTRASDYSGPKIHFSMRRVPPL